MMEAGWSQPPSLARIGSPAGISNPSLPSKASAGSDWPGSSLSSPRPARSTNERGAQDCGGFEAELRWFCLRGGFSIAQCPSLHPLIHLYSISYWYTCKAVVKGLGYAPTFLKTSQESRMLSSATIYCQVTMIVVFWSLNCQNCQQFHNLSRIRCSP